MFLTQLTVVLLIFLYKFYAKIIHYNNSSLIFSFCCFLINNQLIKIEVCEEMCLLIHGLIKKINNWLLINVNISSCIT